MSIWSLFMKIPPCSPIFFFFLQFFQNSPQKHWSWWTGKLNGMFLIDVEWEWDWILDTAAWAYNSNAAWATLPCGVNSDAPFQAMKGYLNIKEKPDYFLIWIDLLDLPFMCCFLDINIELSAVQSHKNKF